MQLSSKPHPRIASLAPRPFVRAAQPECHAMEDDSAKKLWAAVMERAILDLQETRTRNAAIEWITARRDGVGSFIWVCHQLDMAPDSVRRALLRQSVSLSLLQRQSLPPAPPCKQNLPHARRMAHLSNA
ncbi:MAG: hypothetical protein HQM03_02570 [Magnetococcales bacterium]|nr:hypothetical protein [Magnetococcales bacterium]